MNCVQIREAVSIKELVDSSDSGDVYLVDILQEGLNRSGTRFYTPEALNSIALKANGMKCFLDHATDEELAKQPERKFREQVGWYTEVQRVNGIVKGRLHIFSAKSLHQDAQFVPNMIKEAVERGNPGFIQLSIFGTADGELINHNGSMVYRIMKLLEIPSTDLVTFAGAGGRVQEGLSIAESFNQKDKEELVKVEEVLKTMKPEEILKLRPDLAPLTETPAPEKKEDPETIKSLEKRIKLFESRGLLESALREVGNTLPTGIKERISNRFKDRVFEKEELDAAISDEHSVYDKILNELAPGQTRIYAGPEKMGEREKLEKALDGFWMNTNVDGIPKFKNLKEAYFRFMGGSPYDANIAWKVVAEAHGYDSILRVREAGTVLSTTWATILGDSIHRALLKFYDIPSTYDDWKKIVVPPGTITDFKPQKRSRIGAFNTNPVVTEGGTYLEDITPGEEAVTYSPEKRGRLSVLTFEAVANDDLNAARSIPQRLADSARITNYRKVFDLLNDNVSTDYDSAALFSSTHSNLGSTALSSDELQTAKRQMREQTALSASELQLGVKPRYLVVPNELEALGMRLRDSEVLVQTSAFTATEPNIHRGTFELIVVDYWTDANNWYLVADPARVPTIEIDFWNGNEAPEMFTEAPNTGSNFTADKVTFKTRQIIAADVLDHRGFWGAVVV